MQMGTKIYLNNQVSKITGLSPRSIIDWSEKGLILPRQPAKKAGHRRGYDFLNLLEFELAKTFIDTFGLQFYTCKKIMSQLRMDGEISLWASGDFDYLISVRTSERYKIDGEEAVSSHIRTPVRLKARSEEIRPTGGGSLFYVLIDRPATIEEIRVISPWDLRETLRALEFSGSHIEEILSQTGMLVVNLGLLRRNLDEKILK
jgi:DNA-binding transcriptional MerR regulator